MENISLLQMEEGIRGVQEPPSFPLLCQQLPQIPASHSPGCSCSPIIFPRCYGWARPHHHQTAKTNTVASGTEGTSCTAPNLPRPGTNSGEGKTCCLMLGMSPTSMAQPALAFEQGERQEPEQRAAAARGLSSQHLSCTSSSWVGTENSSSWHRRDIHSLFTQNFWPCLLKFQNPRKIYCRSSDITFTQEHTSWQ